MRKFMIAAGAAALLATVSIAAADDEVKGTIKSMDATAHTVTLDNGQTFKVPDGGNWKVGDKLKIKHEGDKVKIELDD